MKRLALLLLLALAAACSDTTGSQRVAFAVEAAGIERDASQPLTFTSDQGWSITLTEARIALGPIYLNTVAPLEARSRSPLQRLGDLLLPSAYADGESHLGAGRIVAEVTSQSEVDALDPSLSALRGGGNGIDVPALTAEVWLFNRDGALGGAAVRVAGTARREELEVPFEGSLVIDQTLVSAGSSLDEARKVRGIPARMTPSAGGTLRVRIDPRGWFDGADFRELTSGTPREGRYRFSAQDNVGRAFLNRVRSRSTFSVSFATGSPSDAAVPDAGSLPDAVTPTVDAALPPSFATPVAPAFSAATREPRTIQVSVSSEDLGQLGFDYTATPASGAIVFVDGWELRFSRILLTLANIRLSGPGASPSDRSSVGALVASVPGSFAVDVQKPGALAGAGGAPETAIPLAVIRAPSAGGSLDTTVRYAFSYDAVAATPGATNVNLDASGVALYQQMIRRGWSQYIEGTATYRGATAGLAPAFADYPSEVTFRLGWAAPVQSINCNNPDNGGDEMPGVQPSATTAARAQITFHMDHLFWGALGVENPPLHFDQFASRARTGAGGSEVTLDDLQGVAPTHLVDRQMRPVPDRGAQTMGYTPRNAAALSFDLGGTSGIRDLRDFVTFSARSNGHLNADGLCFVRPSGPITY
jgi:hypothetical protein